MSHIKKIAETKKATPKNIEQELTSVIADLKTKLDDKKFRRRIKKAIKVLKHGIDKKKTGNTKTASKKVAAKKAVKAKKP